ncbi:uncharacterized protein LOC117336129 [Pecten maximus]|uniref:uncharacterized protein LOC117336129 n=1 Tax=Pecten maximus TaxID=6579 RepID=UPI0014587CD2|nr:uncharacterized protein LOC117336129 [Pecten maximus]
MARFGITRLILLCCCFSLFSSALELPPDGFWFNCGLDFCQFPDDYCRVLEGQRPSCHTCTPDECNTLDTPSQCYTRCKELERGGPDPDTTPVMKGAQLGDNSNEESTNEKLSSLIGENRRQWIAISVLICVIVVAIILLAIILIKMFKNQRILIRRTKFAQEETRPVTAGPLTTGPQQQTRLNDGVNGCFQEITVEPAGAKPGQNAIEPEIVIENRREENIPLLPRDQNNDKEAEGLTLFQPSERSGNVEIQFSPKLMDDGSKGMGRYIKESAHSPPFEENIPVITQPIDDQRSSNLADCVLLDKHNMQQSMVTDKDSNTRRHSTRSDETAIKVVESTENHYQASLPGDIKVQERPRSISYKTTPTAPPAESSVSLSDSGHYSTENNSPTGSVDLKNNTKKQSQATVRVK